MKYAIMLLTLLLVCWYIYGHQGLVDMTVREEVLSVTLFSIIGYVAGRMDEGVYVEYS